MDNLYYVLITYSIVIFSIILALIFLTLKLMRKNKFNKKDLVIILLLVLCAYLYVPFYFYKKGLENSYEEKYLIAINNYKNALKLSINPYERKLLKFDLGCLYYFYDKNGNQAIKYLEGSFKGDYKNPYILPRLYFLKGDYDKVRQIESVAEKSDYYYTALSDVMEGKYSEALNYLLSLEPKTYTDNMLISALYNERGYKEQSQEYYNSAKESFDSILFYNEDFKKEKYDELMSYSSVEKFKESVLNNRKQYGFSD